MEESVSKLDEAKAENNKIADEIKGTLQLIKDGGRKIHAIDVARKELEKDKEYLTDTLEDIETGLIAAEEKYKVQLKEIEIAKEENQRTLDDMDKSFALTKCNHEELMNKLTIEVENMSKDKAEAHRAKQALDNKRFELEQDLIREEQKRIDLEKKAAKILQSIDQTNDMLHLEQSKRDEATKDHMTAEAKCKTLANSLEETKTILEQVDKARRQTEQEVVDTNESLNDLNFQASILSQANQQMVLQVRNLEVKHISSIVYFLKLLTFN